MTTPATTWASKVGADERLTKTWVEIRPLINGVRLGGPAWRPRSHLMAGGWHVYIKYTVSLRVPLHRGSALADTFAVPRALVPSHPCSGSQVYYVPAWTYRAKPGPPPRGRQDVSFSLPASGNQTSLLFQPCLPLHTPQFRRDSVSSRLFIFISCF